jgi:hypothetical protein
LKGRKRRDRYGTLVFLIPVVLVVALAAYAIFDATLSQDGTLIVTAQTSAKYYPVEYLNVAVSLAGKSGTTPFNITLPQGTYTVTFPSQRWFTSPLSRTVNVTARGDSFVVGVYDPIPVTVSVSQTKFNTTAISVLHKVTPLIWVNPTNGYEVISSTLTGRIIIAPMQNYTYVFQESGSYSFSIVGSASPALQVVSV